MKIHKNNIHKTGQDDASCWHTLSASQVVDRFATNVAMGLSSAEAQLRLEQYGANKMVATVRTLPLMLFFHQFKNSLIIILLAATVFSGILGHVIEAIAIGVIILFSVMLGFIQELRAGRALEALSKLAAPTVLVFRDRVDVEIPAQDLVPGDLMVISAGNRFCADARLVKAFNLKVEESVLTGESLPVEKQSQFIGGKDDAIGDRFNMVFAGTNAIYGRGLAVVTATGMQTEFGRIAKMLSSVKKEETPLEKNLDGLVRVLTKIAFVVVTIIVLIGALRGQPLLEMIIFGIALAVAVVPEALPAVVTISLAIGVQRMIERHALVRHLPAVETLGCASIICSDKTGTLTKNEMTVKSIFLADDVIEVTGIGYVPVGEFLLEGKKYPLSDNLTLLLEAAVLSCDARLMKKDDAWHLSGDPTEGALIVVAEKMGIKKEVLDERFPRIAEVPFTSESKTMTTLCQSSKGNMVYVKGAVEIILQSCNRYATNEGVKVLTQQAQDTILNAVHNFAAKALRVIGVAYIPVVDNTMARKDMIFLGFLGMQDPARPEAKSAIKLCRQAGIKLMMITGDHPVTAKAIAQELDLLPEGSRVITGSQLSSMTDSQIEDIIETIAVAARVSPEHKLKIVQALQSRGHIVAMTGDGVNDAPAIKKANIGIAMGITGTDVSREASVMTLVDDNFASIVAAIEEGRIIFDNIKKYLMYLLSSNIGEIGLMVFASLAGLPLPLSAVQILYVNLATDGLPALALAMDPPSRDVMKRSPRKLDRGIFSRPVVLLMVVGGLWSALINMILFSRSLSLGKTLKESMALVFVSLILTQFFKAYNFRSDRYSVLRRPFANKWLNRAIGWELVILLLVIYVPFLQIPFKTHSLSFVDWAWVIFTAVTIIPVLEITKWILRKK